MDCINLKEQFGGRFKVGYEESYFAQHGRHARIEDPWCMILLCRHGHVYPHGGETLAASTDRYGSTARRLAGLDCVTVVQDGDDGVNVTFHVDAFDTVAAVMIPRRKRRGRSMTDEEKRHLADRGRDALQKHRHATSQA